MHLVSTNPQSHPELPSRLNTSDLKHRGQPWYDAYMTVLFEPDSHEVIGKLRWAEKLIIDREREIRDQTQLASAERTALSRASEALRALRVCLKLQK